LIKDGLIILRYQARNVRLLLEYFTGAGAEIAEISDGVGYSMTSWRP
jgi:hypothetical protein